MKKNKSLQPRTPFRQRIILVLFGISLFFVLLEAGLRLGGFILLSLQEYRNNLSIKQKGAYRIFCLGESTTQNTYPPILEEILNQRNIGIKFSVIDKGISGTNTSAILNRVESYLDEYHPDMVVAMMGINDWVGHILFGRPTLSKTMLFIRSFRTYKLAQLLWLHMVTKAKEIGLYKLHRDKSPAQERASNLSNIMLEETNGQQKDNIKNIEVLKKAIKLNPMNDVAYVDLGKAYRFQGQFQQVEECSKKALELNPENYAAYVELGYLYINQGQLRQAEECLKKALELKLRNYKAYVDLGKAYRFQGQFQQAEECLKKALELNPMSDEAYLEFGWLYRSQGQPQQAEECLKKALELNPENYAAYVDLGKAYKFQGQLQQAEDVYKKALELNPKISWAYLELGWLYINQGKFQQAEDVYKKALELNYGEVVSAKLYGALGITYEELGQFMLAEECYSNANQTMLSGYNPMTAYSYHKLKEILDRRNIKLVCVQYPMLNIEPLKKMFQGDIDSVFFVDNEKTFKEAVREGSYKMYFKDIFGGNFGHCTEKGNRLLAENIANVILKGVFYK
jgi:tetratricopeptide (TPR) repeat protein